VGEQADSEQTTAQGDHGGEQRQGHREQRPERDEQDDAGCDEADELAVGGWGLLDLLDGVAAQLDVQAVERIDSPRSMTACTSALGSSCASLAKFTVA